MVDVIPQQQVLTPTDAGSQLQSTGFDVLGLVMPVLSSGWASATPAGTDVDSAALRLRLSDPRAPFRGILHFEQTPTTWSSVSGAPIAGPVAVLALHPEAAQRLLTLTEDVLGAPLTRPMPVAMVVHGVTIPAAPQALDSYEAGEQLFSGPFDVSFHDARGLPIHPLAVASLLLALQTAFPAVVYGSATMPALGAAGGLTGIAGLAAAPVTRVHVIDPHGNAYAAPRDAARLRVLDAASATVSTVPDAGLTTLDAGQTLGRSATELAGDGQNAPLYWGLAHNSTLARTPVTVPPVPAGVVLATQFFRVTAVDLDWHLLGNRAPTTVQTVGGDDDTVPDFALPVVRPAVPDFDYLVDGLDVLGAAGQLATGFPPSGVDVQALLASPAIEASLAVPPAPGATGHWPAFPAPDPATALPPNADATAGITGTWRTPAAGTDAGLDAVVAIAADAVPPGTHVRVYPRRFVAIRSIGAQPSFVRGDGGATIAQAGAPSRVLLVNPFALAPAEPLPAPGVLSVDVVVVGRDGQRRIFSAVDVPLTPAVPWVDNSALFGGSALLQTPGIAALFAAFGFTSVAPSSLFGIAEPPPAAGGTPGSVLELVRRLANETTAPRRGPALPTQARFETVFALGVQPAAAQPYAWRAVLSGARWQEESRSASPEKGDPGNPAGPDVHATGVRVDGQLAQDLATHAIKRAQPAIPLSASTPGWVVMTAGANWGFAPQDTTGTVSAAMLETVAPYCDSPELSLLPTPQPTDTVQSAVNSLAASLGVPAPTVAVANEAQIRQRLQREIVTAKSGQRDALWSLRRAIAQAREFVYIDGPQFARTARPGGTPLAHEVDLVESLRARMAANPRLKVLISLPRVPDFASTTSRYEPFLRAAIAQRKLAIETLTTPFRQRVAAFHPIGFPGRPTAIRSTTVIVDDAWALVGTSHFRRRGMTFDGGCDVVSIDRQLDARGTSAGIRRFRHELLAARLGVAVPVGPATSSALWTRLATPEAAFDAIADLLSAGGLGRCAPIWAGPTDTEVIPRPDDTSDPDGVDPTGANLLALFRDLLLT